MPFSTATPTFPYKSRVWGQTVCDQMPLSSCSMILDLSYLNLLIYEMGMIIICFIKVLKKLNEIIHVKLAATCLVHNKQSMNVSCHFMHIYIAFWASKAECLYVWVWVGLSGFKSWLCDLGQVTEPLCDSFIMYKMKVMTNMNLTHRLIAWTKWYACARRIQNYARHAVRVLEMLAIVMTYLFVLQYVVSEKC